MNEELPGEDRARAISRIIAGVHAEWISAGRRIQGDPADGFVEESVEDVREYWAEVKRRLKKAGYGGSFPDS